MTEFETYARDVGLLDYGVSSDRWIDLREFDADRWTKLFSARDKGIVRYAFAVLTEDVIERLRRYAPILEVGAGNGYWAYEFSKRQIDFIATDIDPACEEFFKGGKTWTDVEPISAVAAVKEFPHRTLLICWPSYSVAWAAQALDIYKGHTVVYVGESSGGCTADDRFHELLNERWELSETIRIPQWPGVHDAVEVYTGVHHSPARIVSKGS